MSTFERYFINDKAPHKEIKNSFFKIYRDKVESCKLILKNFKMDVENSKIICGHVPVKVNKGESPIKADGMLLVIDGGFSKAYQPQTGIAGYTLIYNSYGMQLASHEPFESIRKAIEEEKDILSSKRILDRKTKRIRIKNTDIGTELKNQIKELKMLLAAYKMGLIKENLFRYDRRGI
jgi:fructose-1,6-bisphosphatase-3